MISITLHSNLFTAIWMEDSRDCVNSSHSSWLIGVPQGSILGPNFNNIDSYDLFLFMLMNICNYADDNSTFSFSSTITTVKKKLEDKARVLIIWVKTIGDADRKHPIKKTEGINIKNR